MKGLVGFLFLAFVVVIVLAAGFLNSAIITYKEYSATLKEKRMLQAINNLEYFRMALPSIVEYSFYQASYDLASSGFGEEYWKVYDENTVEKIEPESLLKQKFVGLFNEYSSTVSEFGVSVPRIDVDELTLERSKAQIDKILIKIEPEGKEASVSFGYGKIFSSLKASKELEINTFKLFEVGKEVFVDEDVIGKTVESVMKNLPSACFSKEEFYCGGCAPPGTKLDPTECKDEIQSLLLQELSKYEGETDGLLIDVELNKIRFSFDQSCEVTDCVTTPIEECCAEWESETVCLPCPEEQVEERATPETQEECPCGEETVTYCVEGKPHNWVKCSYSNWKVSADFVVKIFTKHKYPVYDRKLGKTDFLPIVLIFKVKAGSPEVEG